MENPIIIKPKTPQIAILASAVKIRNDFHEKGFKTRMKVIGIVQKTLPEYLDYSKAADLERWYSLRKQSDSINNDLLKVLKAIDDE